MCSPVIYHCPLTDRAINNWRSHLFQMMVIAAISSCGWLMVEARDGNFSSFSHMMWCVPPSLDRRFGTLWPSEVTHSFVMTTPPSLLHRTHTVGRFCFTLSASSFTFASLFFFLVIIIFFFSPSIYGGVCNLWWTGKSINTICNNRILECHNQFVLDVDEI